mmetsp:Transcript_9839/g.32818  ORF Transcript_9839/g.32818 Transcript_9839/m.32818 type:complete len:269 (-) Transcript_9839:1569-2375(-)
MLLHLALGREGHGLLQVHAHGLQRHDRRHLCDARLRDVLPQRDRGCGAEQNQPAEHEGGAARLQPEGGQRVVFEERGVQRLHEHLQHEGRRDRDAEEQPPPKLALLDRVRRVRVRGVGISVYLVEQVELDGDPDVAHRDRLERVEHLVDGLLADEPAAVLLGEHGREDVVRHVRLDHVVREPIPRSPATRPRKPATLLQRPGAGRGARHEARGDEVAGEDGVGEVADQVLLHRPRHELLELKRAALVHVEGKHGGHVRRAEACSQLQV